MSSQGSVTTAMSVSPGMEGKVKVTSWWGHVDATAKFRCWRFGVSYGFCLKARERGILTDVLRRPGKVTVVDETGE